MMNIELFLTITVGLILAGAVVALETENMLAAVLAWGGACLCLSVVFLLVKALDLALVQLIIELLIMLLLLRATDSMELSIPREPSIAKALPRYAAALLLAGILTTCFYFALKEVPSFGLPLLKAAQTVFRTGRDITGFTNLAGAVFLRLRALDAFAVMALLFTAVIGAMSLLRAKGHK
jgi:multisubunit Na+/H+ antiporter MnhB subunit